MILEHPIFTEMILPFLLVFALVFAILQKSKILGDDSERTNVIIALVIGLILITVPAARDLVSGFVPWLAVGLVALLMFLLLYGFVAGDLSGAGITNRMKNIALGVILIFVAGVVLFVSGLWDGLIDWIFEGTSSDIWMSIIMLGVIIGAIAVAINSAKKKE